MRQQLELAIEGGKLGIWSFDPRTGSLWFSDRSKADVRLPPDNRDHGRR